MLEGVRTPDELLEELDQIDAYIVRQLALKKLGHHYRIAYLKERRQIVDLKAKLLKESWDAAAIVELKRLKAVATGAIGTDIPTAADVEGGEGTTH